jgi:hypothetical protein
MKMKEIINVSFAHFNSFYVCILMSESCCKVENYNFHVHFNFCIPFMSRAYVNEIESMIISRSENNFDIMIFFFVMYTVAVSRLSYGLDLLIVVEPG